MKRWREYLMTLVVAVVCALFVRNYLVTAYKVPTGSMQPTLKPGDFIFSSRLSYGFRVPFTSQKNDMKKLRKSSWIAIAFFIYVTATAAYLLPRNTVTSDTEKYLTLAGGYVIVLALWLVLRKKEKLQEQRRREATNNNLNK